MLTPASCWNLPQCSNFRQSRDLLICQVRERSDALNPCQVAKTAGKKSRLPREDETYVHRTTSLVRRDFNAVNSTALSSTVWGNDTVWNAKVSDTRANVLGRKCEHLTLTQGDYKIMINLPSYNSLHSRLAFATEHSQMSGTL